jgi:hypothetical protein
MTSLAASSYVIPLTTVRRERLLPLPGRVLSRAGAKVSAKDIVAQSNLAPEHHLLDVSQGLHVPASKAEKYIERIAGEEVAEGDVIATGPRGLVRRVIRAPVDGRIVYVRNGKVLLQRQSAAYDLFAGYTGVVQELIPDLGVVIEATGALVQAIWGNGQVDSGVMQLAVKGPEEALVAGRLDVSLRGAVLLAGYCEQPQVLQAAAEIPIRGLILGSMAVALAPLAQRMPYPILLTEGFGKLAMNPAAHQLLSTNVNRDVCVNAEALDRDAGIRPEVFIPLPSQGKAVPPPESVLYTPGQKVRIVQSGVGARSGVFVANLPGLTAFPNGVRAPGGEVRLEDGKRVVIPLANIEVLGYK